MENRDYPGIVPPQYTGKEVEADASAEWKDDNEAKGFYETAKRRLLYVNHWHKLAGLISARFQLIDSNGTEVERSVEKGDYLRIDIPGPGSKEGDGYDWVRVEELSEKEKDNIQSIGFRVRPAKNPFGKKNEPAHFYSEEATSSFIVTREGKKVTAAIIDRNIKPNDEVGSITDAIRHTAIGMSAIGAFSKLQWQNLADGIVSQKD